MYPTCISSLHLDSCQCQYLFVVVSSLSYACPRVLSVPFLPHAPTGLCSLDLDCCWSSLGARCLDPLYTVTSIICQPVNHLPLGYSFPQNLHSSLYIHGPQLRADLPYACSPFLFVSRPYSHGHCSPCLAFPALSRARNCSVVVDD